jgi:hypothetical protein
VLLVEESREALCIAEAALNGDGLDLQIGIFEQSLRTGEAAADEFVAQ